MSLLARNKFPMSFCDKFLVVSLFQVICDFFFVSAKEETVVCCRLSNGIIVDSERVLGFTSPLNSFSAACEDVLSFSVMYITEEL